MKVYNLYISGSLKSVCVCVCERESIRREEEERCLYRLRILLKPRV